MYKHAHKKNNVYIIQCTATKLVKIGRSRQVEKRLSALNAISPTKLKLLKIFHDVDENLEVRLHNRFQKYQHKGEWFSPKILPLLLNSRKPEKKKIGDVYLIASGSKMFAVKIQSAESWGWKARAIHNNRKFSIPEYKPLFPLCKKCQRAARKFRFSPSLKKLKNFDKPPSIKQNTINQGVF